VDVDNRAVADAYHRIDAVAGGLVAVLERSDDLLGCGDTAECIGVLLFGGALEEDRRMARMRDRITDVVAAEQQVGVRRSGIERQQGCPGLHQRHDAGGHLAQHHVRDGEDDDVSTRRGLVGVGELAPKAQHQLPALRRVLTIEDPIVTLREIVRNPLSHFAARADDADGDWPLGHDFLLK
jgi:phage gp37-like protein